MKLFPVILFNIIIIILQILLELDELKKSKTRKAAMRKILCKYFLYTFSINGIWIILNGLSLLLKLYL